MGECVFCKIVKGEVPCYKLLENDKVLGFLDTMPSAEGHSLVIPKKHFETVLEMDQETLEQVIVATQRVAKAIVKAVNADGFNIHQSNNRAAGQVVMHAHFHIFPRWQGDGFTIPWKHEKLEEKKAKELQNKINKLLQ